jgi:hypothetical protein
MTANGFAGKSDLLGLTQRRYRDVVISEQLKFRIQSLTEGEKSSYEASILTGAGKVNKQKLLAARRRLLVMCLVDGEGLRLLTESDADQLAQMDGAVASRIYDVCQDHCGFSDEDIEGLVKNSGRGLAEDSPSE